MSGLYRCEHTLASGHVVTVFKAGLTSYKASLQLKKYGLQRM